MGTFFVEVLLAAPTRPERREAVELLVDSGSPYTWVGTTRLRALSIAPTERRRFVTIEGHVVERDAAEGLIAIAGRTLHNGCLSGGAGDPPPSSPPPVPAARRAPAGVDARLARRGESGLSCAARAVIALPDTSSARREMPQRPHERPPWAGVLPW